MSDLKVAVIIPALSEEESIGQVIDAIPKRYRDLVVVGDNGSTDKTADVARSHGAHVVLAQPRGYGSACLAAVQHALTFEPTILVFLDADYSDYPEDMIDILDELENKNLDMVIGSRALTAESRRALLPQARFGNWLATALMFLRFGTRFTDLGPFRAIRVSAYNLINMQDKNFGWTIEMQIKAIRAGLRVGEVPVRYRTRIGKSKITGTIRGTIGAGTKILWTLAKYSFFQLPKEMGSPSPTKSNV